MTKTSPGLSFDGIVGEARTNDEAFADDHRLSVYQRVRYGPLWQLLAGVAVWMASTTWVGYERWKTIRDDST